MFCRIPDCSKATHNYMSTNNLRTHIGSHKDVLLATGNTGGRVSQGVIYEAIKWYNGLVAGVEPDSTIGSRAGSTTSTSPARMSLPAHPKKM
ncbi:hypothetical protein BDW68DRAFT_165088 [Aspergillus falconensis]